MHLIHAPPNKQYSQKEKTNNKKVKKNSTIITGTLNTIKNNGISQHEKQKAK